MFIRHFYRKYQGLKREELLPELLDNVKPSPHRYAVIFRSVAPEPAHGHAPAAQFDQPVMQKGPPFCRRLSPNRPSNTPDIASLRIAPTRANQKHTTGLKRDV